MIPQSQYQADPSAQQPINEQMLQAMQLTQTRNRLIAQVKSGGGWYWWIGGMSIINTVLWLTGSSTTFTLGLGITQLLSGIVVGILESPELAGSSSLILAIASAVNLAIAVVFLVFGFFARKGQRWAFWVGMVLYGLDALVFVWAQEWFSLLFHGIALFGLFNGVRAVASLNKLDQSQHSAMGSQPSVHQPIGGLKL